MDSRFLESFLMVIDNGSIAETARRLNITAAGAHNESVLSKPTSALASSFVLANACGPPKPD